MNKKKYKTDIFDFDVRYDQEKDRNKTLNTDSVLEKKEELRQFYTGLYYQKCYHNTGRYKWINGDQEYVYEGKLYANDLHGYGRLVYPDNSTYEGLFFHNKRFGPGVVTYVEGLQDIGLWDGKYLVRLSQNIDLADTFLETVPNIGKTVKGKLFLLKYKKIVPITNENDPVANLVKNLKMKAEDSELLYSKCVRNYKSIFMNRSIFDKNFYTDPKELIVDVVDHFDENEEPVINKITAINLLAWNNENIFIEIMKHSFMNRKYEKVISYKIRNAFLPNKRDLFMNEGPIEEMCLKLLVACRNDDTVNISKLISDYDLCPNVCDCYGNTTIIYAAMVNKRNAIKTLVNFGANINALNDECLSAISLCILNYIAIKNEILEENWETSFLKLSDDASMSVNGRIWPTGSSSTSFESEIKDSKSSSAKSGTASTTKSKKQKNTAKKKKQKNNLINKQFVFNLIYKDPPRQTLSKRVIMLRKKLKLSKIYRKTIHCDKTESLDNVMKTIQTLLECGADVSDSEVPFPPLISSLFSDNAKMVELILNSNVDVNKGTRAESGNLNPLHIVCAMNNSRNQEEIMDMLLTHGAEVDARSNIQHWPEARDKILAGETLEFDEFELGKTPFHVLAMRYDFQDDNENRILNIAKMLVQNGADAEKQYLGHNMLSLATLRGNVELMDHILNNTLCDPNGILGYNMGVPLTMLTLRKYSKLLMPQNKLESLFDTLIKNYANPFNEVTNFEGNALEFAVATDKQTASTSKDNIGLNMLITISASVLRRYIDSHALQLIYKSLIRNKQNISAIANVVVKYLDFEKSHRILQILLDNNIIPPNYDLAMKLLNYVYARTAKGKLKINFIDKPGFEKVESNHSKINNIKKSKTTQFEMSKTLVQIKEKNNVYELDFNKEDIDEIVNPYKENMPEIDLDHKKYKVCYGCLEKINKKLQLCPYCTLVYFCSIKCNEMKNKSGEHPCKKVIYNCSQGSISRVKSIRKTRGKSMRGTHYTSIAADALMTRDDFMHDDDDYTSSLDLDISDSDITDSESSTSTSKRRRRKHEKNRKRRRRRRKRIRGRGRKRFKRRNKWYTPNKFIMKKGKKICSATCKGKLVAIEFKESLKEIEKKMRRKFTPPEIKHLRREVWSNKMKCKFPLNEDNIDLMLRVAKRVNLQLIPVLDSNNLLNPCDPFDYKFWQLFLPYCVFQNGDLFYRANDSDLLYKLPYKHI